MILIAIVAGAIAGRWWIVPIVALAWTVLVMALGDCDLSCAPERRDSPRRTRPSAWRRIRRFVSSGVRSVGA